MLAMTTLVFYKDIKILFTRESAAYLSKISDVNYFFSIVFCFLYLIVSLLFFKKIGNSVIVVSLAIIVMLWFFCGRVIAIKPFPDGRVIVGWYYIETGRFNLCDIGADCEAVLSRETRLEKKMPWMINVKNERISVDILVGPFTWNSFNATLEIEVK